MLKKKTYKKSKMSEQSEANEFIKETRAYCALCLLVNAALKIEPMCLKIDPC